MRLLLTTFDPGRSTKYHFAVLLAAYQPNLALTSKSINNTAMYFVHNHFIINIFN